MPSGARSPSTNAGSPASARLARHGDSLTQSTRSRPAYTARTGQVSQRGNVKSAAARRGRPLSRHSALLNRLPGSVAWLGSREPWNLHYSPIDHARGPSGSDYASFAACAEALLEARRDRDEARQEAAAACASREKCARKLLDAESKLQQLKDRRRDDKSRWKKCEEQLQQLHQEYTDLQQQAERSSADLAEATARNSELTQRVEELTQSNEARRRELAQYIAAARAQEGAVPRERHEQQLGELQGEVGRLQERAAAGERRAAAAEAAAAEAGEREVALHAKVRDLMQRLRQMEAAAREPAHHPSSGDPRPTDAQPAAEPSPGQEGGPAEPSGPPPPPAAEPPGEPPPPAAAMDAASAACSAPLPESRRPTAAGSATGGGAAPDGVDDPAPDCADTPRDGGGLGADGGGLGADGGGPGGDVVGPGGDGGGPAAEAAPEPAEGAPPDAEGDEVVEEVDEHPAAEGEADAAAAPAAPSSEPVGAVAEEAQHEPPPGNGHWLRRLRLHAVRGDSLLSAKRGPSNPVLVVLLKGPQGWAEVWRTQAVSRSYDPQWGEEATITEFPELAEEGLEMRLAVFHKSEWDDYEDWLGSCDVPVPREGPGLSHDAESALELGPRPESVEGDMRLDKKQQGFGKIFVGWTADVG